MSAKELLDAGRLSAAIAQVTEEVKAKPADLQQRTFLFELLCFSGDLERAGKQLDVLGQASADSEIAIQRYRNILRAERARRRLFSEGLRPRLPDPAPAYTGLHLEAANRLREDRAAEARALLEEAEDSRPALRGRLNNEPFEDFKDCDDLIGPFLEAIFQEDYHWVAWESVKSVSLQPPKYLRDLVWMPARVELRAGTLGEAFLPALYLGSHLHRDEQVKLGRTTDWKSNSGELALGLGQRLLAAGDRDIPMLEVREIEFEDANLTGH